jgi:tetratricopeptide (TPR) repeat protein
VFKNLANISNKKAFILITILSFIVFGNSIKNDYSLDDHLVIKNHPYTTKGIKGIKDIFTHYSFLEYRNKYAYRPILLTTFAIEYQFFGENPHVSHFISILLYALVCYLVFLILSEIISSENYIIKWMIIALFIAYPLHTEVVDNIKSRDELLVAIFGFSAMLQSLRFMKDGNYLRWLYIMLFLGLGYLTKPNIYVYLGGVLLILFIFQTDKKKLLRSLLYFIGSFAFLAVLIFIFKKSIFTETESYRKVLYFENPMYYMNLSERIPAGIYVMLYYLKLLVFPFELSYYYGYNHVPMHNWSSLWVYVSLAIIIFFVWLFFKTFKNHKIIAFAVAFMWLNLFAASNIVKPLPGIVAERFVFAGSLGFLILLVFGVKYLLHKIKKEKYFTITIILLFIIFSIRTIARNDDWRDDFYIFDHDLTHLQNSAKAHAVVANQLFGYVQNLPQAPDVPAKLKRAEKEYKECLKIYPEYATSINNLGTIYFKFYRDYPKALEMYKQSYKLDTTNANVAFNLAVVYQNLNKQDSAWHYYKKAIRLNPGFDILNQAFVNYCVKVNKVDEGIKLLTTLLNKHPKEYGIYLSLGNLYVYKSDFNSALKYYREGYEIFPNDILAQHIKKLEMQINKMQ